MQVTLHGTQDMLTDIIYPGSLESRAQLEEDLNEMREQLRKQVHRLRELRIKKVEEPGTSVFQSN
jgi:elongator complex protein 1